MFHCRSFLKAIYVFQFTKFWNILPSQIGNLLSCRALTTCQDPVYIGVYYDSELMVVKIVKNVKTRLLNKDWLSVDKKKACLSTDYIRVEWVEADSGKKRKKKSFEQIYNQCRGAASHWKTPRGGVECFYLKLQIPLGSYLLEIIVPDIDDIAWLQWPNNHTVVSYDLKLAIYYY